MEKLSWQKAGPNKVPAFAALLGVLLCGVCLYAPVSAAGIGGSSGAYLRPPLGAVATGLGGACTAAPDFYAAWWNPSTPSLLRDRRIAGGTGMRSLGRMEAFGAYDFRVPQRAGLGIMALYRGDPSLGKLYDSDERLLPGASYTTMTIKTALSYLVNRRISAGIAVNIFYQSLPSYGEAAVIEYGEATSIGSVDLAVSYAASDAWKLAAVLKNIRSKMDWQMPGFLPGITDRPLPSLTAGSSYTASLAGKPLIWALDAKVYALDGTWKELDRAEIVLGTGAEWRGWDNLRARAGIGDLSFTSDVFSDTKTYREGFGMRFTTGFSYKPVKKRKGLWINYAAATDKIWAGVDQQLDVTLAF